MSIFRQIRSILGRNDGATAASAAPGDDSPAPPSRVERRARKRLGTHRGRRILIVDDSPTIVAALRKMLQSAGCETLEALDATAGLELVREKNPDLIFLDIVLPGMNGFAALRFHMPGCVIHQLQQGFQFIQLQSFIVQIGQ